MSDTQSKTAATKLTDQEIKAIQEKSSYSTEQIHEWYAGFIDECPSGRLGQQEFMTLYKQFYPNISSDDKFSKLAFESFDTNRDGFIDFTEFVFMITAAAKVEASIWAPNMKALITNINQAWSDVTPFKGMLTSGINPWPGLLPPQDSSKTSLILMPQLVPVHYLILSTSTDKDSPIVKLSEAPKKLEVKFGEDIPFLINDIQDVEGHEGQLVFKLVLLTKIGSDKEKNKLPTVDITDDHVKLVKEFARK